MGFTLRIRIKECVGMSEVTIATRSVVEQSSANKFHSKIGHSYIHLVRGHSSEKTLSTPFGNLHSTTTATI